MKMCMSGTAMKGIAALGIISAGIVTGAAVGCTIRSMCHTSRMPRLKKNAKRALRNAEHYIDRVM